MNLPHAHALLVHGHSPLHRLSAHAKVAGLVAFAIAVASVPRTWWVVLVIAGLVPLSATLIARLSPSVVFPRLLIEVPFLVFALLLPFAGGGPRVDVGPVALSVDGLWAAWAIIAKSSLCLAASIVVTATTSAPDLLAGLRRLRVPGTLVMIAGFMVRYVDVVIGEARRMGIAMTSRGYRPTRASECRPIVSGAGALFMRSYERGERVYDAMLARGYGVRL